MNQSILVLSLNPTLQKITLFPEGWKRGQVNRSGQYRLSVSGKGANSARILAQLQENVTYMTQLGGRNREFFLEELRKEGIKVVWDDSSSEVRYCQTLISMDPPDITEIVEEGEEVSPNTDQSIRDHFTESLSVADWLVIIGSKAPGFSDTIYLDAAKEAAEIGVPVVLDINTPALPEFLKYKPRLVKINAFEFCQSFFPDIEVPQIVGKDLQSKIKDSLIKLSSEGTDFIITNGAEKILMASKGQVSEVEPLPMEPVNPIGCGDAMTAGMTAGLSKGKSLSEALELGMSCSKKNGELLSVGTLKAPEEIED